MRTLYDEDVLAWAESQAAALRAMGRSELSAAADWERLARGIERVGHWAQGHVEAGIRTMLAQAVAGYCEPDTLRRADRSDKTRSGQWNARRQSSSTIRLRVDLDRLWREAIDLAIAELDHDRACREALRLEAHPGTAALNLAPNLPAACPFTLDELLADDFTYDSAIERLYVRLTSWRPKARKELAT